MKTTDDELIRQLRAELDELVGGARDVAGAPPPAQPSDASAAGHSDRRWMAICIAAASVAVLVGGLVVLADRDAGDATSETPPATSPTVPSTAPITTAPTIPSTAPEPTADAVPATEQTSPSTTARPVVRPPADYEVIAPVLETAERGIQLCLGQWMAASTPPLCEGPALQGWSWDAVGGGNTVTSGTWAEAYVSGTWDPTTQVFTVTEARAPTGADHDRFGAYTPRPDLSVPCPEPAGGWPARNQEWPAEQIHMLPGYAGSWEDPTHQVVTVKFTGDLAAAEAAVRQFYGDALCVVPAQHSEAELVAISNQLLSMSSVKFLWSQVYSDATGEWVEAGVIVPDHERQAAFDQQYGEGVVRLTPRLRLL
jgi:hypothetical protein